MFGSLGCVARTYFPTNRLGLLDRCGWVYVISAAGLTLLIHTSLTATTREDSNADPQNTASAPHSRNNGISPVNMNSAKLGNNMTTPPNAPVSTRNAA